MLCSRIRTALSARLDGEELPPGLTARRLDDHLAGCPGCRRWHAQAHALTTGLDRAHAPPEGDRAAADALLTRLRSAAVLPGPVAPGTADTGGKRAG
ncbi:zf-HC2 domain-containing protein [Streptomyces tubercidicus]